MADYRASVEIDAPPEVVFAHLVTVEGMLARMGEHAELDAAEGGAFVLDVMGVPVRGRFLVVDPPRRVVVTWGMAGSDEFPEFSRVEFTLMPSGTGTRLVLVHSALPESFGQRYAAGWQRFLGCLQEAGRAAAAGGGPTTSSGERAPSLGGRTR